MKPTIKLLTLPAFFFLTFFVGFSQSIMVSYGPAYTTTKIVEPVAGNKKIAEANAADVYSLSYEHFLSKNPISFFASLSKFDGYTFVFYEKGSVVDNGGDDIFGDGYSGVKVYRCDVGAAYRLTVNKRRFYFSPLFSVGLQISKPKADTEIYPFDVNGPEIVETEPTSAEEYNTVQLVPSLGFRTGFVFWKRLDIGLSFQGVLGYKPYQKMYLAYEYKGVPQKTGEFEANGTGLFVTLGIGYRFAKLIQ